MMELRKLGASGLLVSPLGLGLAALGRPGYINLGHAQDLDEQYGVAQMEAHAHAVLDAAWDAGVRYYDAARSYGRAEQFLASWLASRGIAPDAVTVGSKWGYTYTAGWQVKLPAGENHEVKSHTLPVLQRQMEESLQLLGAHLDLYQVHSATLDSGVLANSDVLDALHDFRRNGLAIGLSVSGPRQAETIMQALKVQRDGELLFDTVQATWNLLERSTTAALQAAHDAGLGVIIKEALANGRLTSKNKSPEFASRMKLLHAVSREYSCTPDSLALAAVLNQPFVDLTLSGAATVNHLHSNVQALHLPWDPALARELTPLQEPVEKYWQTRSQLPWN